MLMNCLNLGDANLLQTQVLKDIEFDRQLNFSSWLFA